MKFHALEKFLCEVREGLCSLKIAWLWIFSTLFPIPSFSLLSLSNSLHLYTIRALLSVDQNSKKRELTWSRTTSYSLDTERTPNQMLTKDLIGLLCTARSINSGKKSSSQEARLKRTYHVLQRKRSAHVPSLLWILPKVCLQNRSARTLHRQLLDIVRNGIDFFSGSNIQSTRLVFACRIHLFR
jgi:hypothetical protein